MQEMSSALPDEDWDSAESASPEADEPPAVFEPEEVKALFQQSFQDNVKRLSQELPAKILEKVADIRVLALGRASAEVKKAVAAFDKANERS